MKKSRKVFSLVALSFVAVALGVCCLTGCGSNVSVSDIENFVAKSSTQTEMTEGYKSELIIGDAVVTQHILFGESGVEAKCVMNVPESTSFFGEMLDAGYMEIYIKDGYYYFRENETDKYTRLSTDSGSSGSYIDITGILESREMSGRIETFISVFKEMEGYGLKTTKTEKNNLLTYKMSYKDSTGETGLTLVFEKISDGYKISSFSFDFEAMGEAIDASFEATNEVIEFPADLETNVEEGTESGNENEGGAEAETGEKVFVEAA